MINKQDKAKHYIDMIKSGELKPTREMYAYGDFDLMDQAGNKVASLIDDFDKRKLIDSDGTFINDNADDNISELHRLACLEFAKTEPHWMKMAESRQIDHDYAFTSCLGHD